MASNTEAHTTKVMEEKQVVEDLSPLIKVYTDGTVERLSPPLIPASLDQPQKDFFGVRTKDVHVDPEKGLWVRIFKPPVGDNGRLLPVVLFFHGGGFVFGSPATINFHRLCADLAVRSQSVWVSASYRLAPEHRLPAAHEDAYSAFSWLRSQASKTTEPWLASGVDFHKCFVVGESAGGNIAHHVALHATAGGVDSVLPLRVVGMALLFPAFVRRQRTRAEEESPQDEVMNWRLADGCLRLTLPRGEDDCFGLLQIPSSHAVISLRTVPNIVVALADRDGLVHAGREYCDALKLAGCNVDIIMSVGVGHAFYVRDPHCVQAEELMEKLASFFSRSSTY